MKLKKIIMATIFIAIGMTAFTAGLKPKEGYLKLKWGTSTDDAKKAGYNLSEVSAADKEFLKQNYSEGVSAYIVTSKDKTPTELQFFYYMGRLFQVTELLPETQSSRDKLEKRYGKFPEIGILEIGDQYACVELTKEGKLEAYWLIITKHPKGGVITSFYDWNIFKNVSAFGKQLAGNDTKEEKSFVGELSSLAEKLVQDGNGKATYAFLALTSDDGNALVENYVTDALTEAMFNTGKIKIVERASIEKILNEQQFQDSALVNENTASEIGNLTGANYVCYGTVKDLGAQITLNVKVVEVSTAELCSMGRETVEKDEYLKGVGFEARKVNSGSAKKTSSNANEKTVTHVENNLWEVTSERNDFDEYTLYYFCNKGNRSDGFQLRIFYYKYDNPTKSTVWSGVRWNNDTWTGNYDFKGDSGEIKTYNLQSSYTTKMSGQQYGYATGKNGECRFLVEMFKNNAVLSVKRSDMAVKFQTAGLEEKMNENGITWEEINTALSNLEF